MAFKVLIVDDSTFYRRRLREILDEDRDLTVVGEAKNGEEALAKLMSLSPDVVTMDVEMPVMDGISAVKAIMQKRPVPILMFSSITHAGAQATLDALEAGALDFLPKKFEEISRERKDAVGLLRTKVRLLARRGVGFRRPALARTPPMTRSSKTLPDNAPKSTFFRSSGLLSGRSDGAIAPSVTSVRASGKHYKCLAIGASTGGPVALQKLLSGLPATFPYPILLVQHMPGTFTHAFAQRLHNNCAITVKEAAHGDLLKPGCAYLAPGGKQMVVEGTQAPKIVIRDALEDEVATYKPSVDITFASLAGVFQGDVLGVILTGMGADGRDGCQQLYNHGAKIWAQDQASCVVYGMPQAVAKANITDKSMDVEHMASCILSEMVN
ncbi:chemotaxis response regulator protein-glutamate methylesterase [Alteromonas sp. C1M14]|uniref:protein-glutamate methylesterase/protein-glutamine glutaminase n=1 Tax=Alteromonas sp. C1M14 TaxID=2841567 RepID=UPI001C08721F|nr:chemotaxis response regulator protein-glutamate methylesterase [Alteromonas sp. C1M14]MBU2977984.1 chemotaxis response regulator protein-glutamate methylesterase [Alteromonas sp. C1M14]